MLEPKRIHRRRVHRDKLKGNAQRGHTLAFGAFGLKALEPKFITSRQIEACRVAIARSLQRDGKTFIRIFPDRPMTSKPAETRMGKGKGALDQDRKSTRLNSSHVAISYAVFCLKKKNKTVAIY